MLVRNILEHAHDFEWKMQDIGLLGLRLDGHRQYRLHVWSPDRSVGPVVIHDHPYDFVSRTIVGELTNIRHVEDPAGIKYVRIRYSPSNEELRTTDMVQLAGTSETYREGDAYAQLAPELHDSRQLPGNGHGLAHDMAPRRRTHDVSVRGCAMGLRPVTIGDVRRDPAHHFGGAGVVLAEHVPIQRS